MMKLSLDLDEKKKMKGKDGNRRWQLLGMLVLLVGAAAAAMAFAMRRTTALDPKPSEPQFDSGVVVPNAEAKEELSIWSRAALLNYDRTVEANPPVGVEKSGPQKKLVVLDGTEKKRAVVEGGHALGEFAAVLWLRTTEGCGRRSDKLFVDYDTAKNATWYFGGCPLFNGMYSRIAPPSWKPEWRKRRSCCPVRPETDLHSPGGLSEEAKAGRANIRTILWRGPRSDFGLSLAPDGDALFFGTGHRDFSFEPGRAARPVRETTLRATTPTILTDGQWHLVVAVRSRPSSFMVDDFADEDLSLYVDGEQLFETHLSATGGDDGKFAAAAVRLAEVNETRRRWPEPHELHDAPHFVSLGQLFTGCLYGAHLQRHALTAADVARLFEDGPSKDITSQCDTGKVLDNEEKKDHMVDPIPLYFMAHTDNGSVAMRDDFVRSIQDPTWKIEPREITIDKVQTTQRMRYGPKGDLIQRALTENPEGSMVLISDIDIRFFRPMFDIVDVYAKSRNVDVVFQRDEDWSLQANLGFMALRCNDNVRTFFNLISDMAHRYATNTAVPSDPSIRGGDQKLVNVALRSPHRLPMLPHINWGLFPTEFMSRSIDQQRGMLYKHEANSVMYHVNDFGADKNSPEKARKTKVDLLMRAERRHIDARAFYRPSDFDSRYPRPPPTLS